MQCIAFVHDTDRLGAVGIQVSIKRALNYAVGEPEGSLALSSRPVDLAPV